MSVNGRDSLTNVSKNVSHLISRGETLFRTLAPSLENTQEELENFAETETERDAYIIWVVIMSGIVSYLASQYGVVHSLQITRDAIGLVEAMHNHKAQH